MSMVTDSIDFFAKIFRAKEEELIYCFPDESGRMIQTKHMPRLIPLKSTAIHEVIREARTSQGITQTFLAKKIGISVHYLRKIESGDNDPSLKVVRQLSTALNRSLTFTITPE